MANDRLLTERELAFVTAYKGFGDGARAVIAAGYASGSAKVTACKLLQKPGVRRPLEEKQRQIVGLSVKVEAAKLSRLSVQSGATRQTGVKVATA